MRFVELAPVSDKVAEMQKLYGAFDLGLDGLPNGSWEGRNIKRWQPPGREMLQHAYFPQVYLSKIRVHRVIWKPLGDVYAEIVTRWSLEYRKANALDHFVKCYCFGDGAAPNLFWYGAAWELSPQLAGEPLAEAIKIFVRNGFSHAYTEDKRKLRTLEYW